MCYLVRVELERQLPVCALDLLIGGARRNAEDLKRVEWPDLPRAATVLVREALHARRKRTSSAALRMCTRSAAAKSQSSTRETLPASTHTRKCLPRSPSGACTTRAEREYAARAGRRAPTALLHRLRAARGRFQRLEDECTTRQRRAWAAAARPHCDSVSLKRFAAAGLDLGRLKMRCLRHAVSQPQATPLQRTVPHSVKGIRNIMSSDSTKMDASTEFDAVLAFVIVSGACEARPGAHAQTLATAPYGGAVSGAHRRFTASDATLAAPLLNRRERGCCER